MYMYIYILCIRCAGARVSIQFEKQKVAKFKLFDVRQLNLYGRYTLFSLVYENAGAPDRGGATSPGRDRANKRLVVEILLSNSLNLKTFSIAFSLGQRFEYSFVGARLMFSPVGCRLLTRNHQRAKGTVNQ